MTALAKASYWSHAGKWHAPHISVPIDAAQLCPHSALPRLVTRVAHGLGKRPPRLTIELTAASGVPIDEIAVTLGRLRDAGIRLSCDTVAGSDYAFDELRVHLGHRSDLTPPGGSARPPALLATGVATGDQLMAALAAGATCIDGPFAGAVRSDSTGIGRPISFEPFRACV